MPLLGKAAKSFQHNFGLVLALDRSKRDCKNMSFSYPGISNINVTDQKVMINTVQHALKLRTKGVANNTHIKVALLLQRR